MPPGPPAGPPPATMGPPPRPPPPPRRPPDGLGLDPPRSGPKPMVLATRRLNVYCAGPRPEFRGSSGSPGVGFGSSRPYGVMITPGLLGSVAMPGRLLNNVVPKRSLPVVMSNGAPDCSVMNGLRRMSHFVLIDPPMKARLRMSVEAGPYSPE